jgi:hypothetical protein
MFLSSGQKVGCLFLKIQQLLKVFFTFPTSGQTEAALLESNLPGIA